MPKSIKGTKTEKNLLAAFAGESQARNRYTFFAKQAGKEGYKQIEALFLETAENEKAHAKQYFKHLQGGMVEITASYPAGVIGTTKENLLAAAKGEHEEWEVLYKRGGDIAKEEGFDDVAETFYNIAKVEMRHEARYRKLFKNIEDGKVFKKDKSVLWKCENCGYVHEGKEAVDSCPACKHPKAHFELFVEAY